MVRNEIRRAFADPRKVANAELPRFAHRGGEHQPCWVGERARAGSRALGRFEFESTSAQRLCQRQVQAEEVAAVVGHVLILTTVDSFPRSLASSRQSARDHPPACYSPRDPPPPPLVRFRPMQIS